MYTATLGAHTYQEEAVQELSVRNCIGPHEVSTQENVITAASTRSRLTSCDPDFHNLSQEVRRERVLAADSP